MHMFEQKFQINTIDMIFHPMSVLFPTLHLDQSQVRLDENKTPLRPESSVFVVHYSQPK